MKKIKSIVHNPKPHKKGVKNIIINPRRKKRARVKPLLFEAVPKRRRVTKKKRKMTALQLEYFGKGRGKVNPCGPIPRKRKKIKKHTGVFNMNPKRKRRVRRVHHKRTAVHRRYHVRHNPSSKGMIVNSLMHGLVAAGGAAAAACWAWSSAICWFWAASCCPLPVVGPLCQGGVVDEGVHAPSRLRFCRSGAGVKVEVRHVRCLDQRP